MDAENNKTISTNDLDRSSRKSLSHLEDLSNELMYEVFEFLDFCDAYEAFFDLNTRFQHLLTHSSLPIHINLSFVTKTAFERYYTNIIIPYQHRITSLHLSNLLIINRTFSFNAIPFVFTRLKKLCLTDFNTPLHTKILIHLVSFPHLSSLTINVTDDSQNRYNFYRDIFSLRTLKYCKVSSKEIISHEPLPVATTTFSPIEYLVINHTIDFVELNVLLSYLPQLRHLSLCYLCACLREQVKWSPIVSNRLTYVSLNVNYRPFDNFESMFRNLFNQVRVLYISTKSDEIMYLDGNQWERLIVSSMPYLRIFDLSIFCATAYGNRFLPYIAQFKSSFWTERQWFFEYQTRKQSCTDGIFLYSTNPYRKNYFSLHGEKEGNMDIHDEKTNIDSVHYVDILEEKAVITCPYYFPNTTEVRILGHSMKRYSRWIFPNLNSIIPLKQLTKLYIDCIYCTFPDIIKLLSCAQNIHILDINFDFDSNDFELLQQTENFQLVCKTNNLRKLIVQRKFTLEVMNFLVRLFPRIQHLGITKPGDNLEQILPFLLSKSNTNTGRLSSLCMNVAKQERETLKALIESEKLLDDDSIYLKHDIYDKVMCVWR